MISSILVFYGFMGWAGIPTDIATVLAGSIGVGVGDAAITLLPIIVKATSKSIRI